VPEFDPLTQLVLEEGGRTGKKDLCSCDRGRGTPRSLEAGGASSPSSSLQHQWTRRQWTTLLCSRRHCDTRPTLASATKSPRPRVEKQALSSQDQSPSGARIVLCNGLRLFSSPCSDELEAAQLAEPGSQ